MKKIRKHDLEFIHLSHILIKIENLRHWHTTMSSAAEMPDKVEILFPMCNIHPIKVTNNLYDALRAGKCVELKI